MMPPKLSVAISALEKVTFETDGAKVALSVLVGGVTIFRRSVSADTAQAVADAAHCHAAAAKQNEVAA